MIRDCELIDTVKGLKLYYDRNYKMLLIEDSKEYCAIDVVDLYKHLNEDEESMQEPNEMSNLALIMEFESLICEERDCGLSDEEYSRKGRVNSEIMMRMNEGHENRYCDSE